MNKVRIIYTIGRRARNISIKKGDIYYFKIKIIPFIINLKKLCHLLLSSSSLKTELQYQKNSPYFTAVQWDISYLAHAYPGCHVRASYIACIGTHAHCRQVTSLLCLSDVIM